MVSTITADTPGVPDSQQVTRMGGGVGLKVMDSGSITHRGLLDQWIAIAEKKKIAYELKVLPARRDRRGRPPAGRRPGQGRHDLRAHPLRPHHLRGGEQERPGRRGQPAGRLPPGGVRGTAECGVSGGGLSPCDPEFEVPSGPALVR